MNYLTTATGRKIPCDYFNPNEHIFQVDIQVFGISVLEAAVIFSDKSETVQLWFGNRYIANHTRLVAIMPSSDSIRVVLGKE